MIRGTRVEQHRRDPGRRTHIIRIVAGLAPAGLMAAGAGRYSVGVGAGSV